MIAYFPDIYPDELIYSQLLRYYIIPQFFYTQCIANDHKKNADRRYYPKSYNVSLLRKIFITRTKEKGILQPVF